MKIVIIEDEQPAIKLLSKLIHEIDPEIEIVHVLESVSESARWFKAHAQPDLIFMDIRLSDGLSFELFSQVDILCPIIFTTAYDEYVMRAFSVNSVDYLLKPINREQVSKALEKFRKFHSTGVAPIQAIDLQTLAKAVANRGPIFRNRFLIPMGERYISIPTSDILYFVSAHKQTYLATKENRRFPINEPLDMLQNEVDMQQFFRANRQYLVGFSAISAIHTFFNGKLKVTLRGTDDEVLVSKEKAGEFKKWLGA